MRGRWDGGRLLANPQVLSLLAQWLLMCADRSEMLFSKSHSFRNVLDSVVIFEILPQQLLPSTTAVVANKIIKMLILITLNVNFFVLC